jgi:3-hydroxyisobutyrate dehydrogenase
MRVGIAGLGKMGRVFTERLLAAGHEVAVWNRSPGPAAELAGKGAKAVTTPADLTRASDLVITVVTDDKAFPDVYEGAKGLLAGGGAGKLFVEMSTVSPAAHQALEKKVTAAGGRFIECPVSGSVAVAREGRCLGFAGGSAADVDYARPVLDVLCRRVDNVGPVGAGAALKLAINLPLLVYWQALGEALALCEPYGFDPKSLIELFAESTGGTNALKTRGPGIAASLTGTEPPVTAALDTLAKDVKLMLATAAERGHPSPLVETVDRTFRRAQQLGRGGTDCSAHPAYWARKGKDELAG